MKAKEKAENLVNRYRMVLMNEDTNCGHEILCTSIAKQCAIIAVDEILSATNEMVDENTGYYTDEYWNEVKTEIEKI
jgi:hypothetical protein